MIKGVIKGVINGKYTNMKKIIGLFAVAAIMLASPVFAQEKELPSAGLTPESNFYFVDKFGEALREFFIFNPEGKARIQIAYAAERVAEIRIILESKGVEAKGLEIAQSRLQAHLANASMIVSEQKAKGKDVSQLAKELNDEFEGSKLALKQGFKEQERALEAQEESLEQKIAEAHRAGDTAQVENLVQQLGQTKAQKELLELKEEEAEESLEKEEEKLEEEMEAKEKAEKAIKEAEEEKEEVMEEAAKEGTSLPTGAFARFDTFIAQAKSALALGNYQEARRLGKQAGKILDEVEEMIEILEEAKEEEEELKEEQAENEREAKERQEEKIEDEEKENGDEDDSD